MPPSNLLSPGYHYSPPVSLCIDESPKAQKPTLGASLMSHSAVKIFFPSFTLLKESLQALHFLQQHPDFLASLDIKPDHRTWLITDKCKWN
jgi:hypothetical protein